jgi:hypothetical protein
MNKFLSQASISLYATIMYQTVYKKEYVMKKSMMTTLGLAAVTVGVSMFSTAQAEVLKLELPEPYFGGTPLDYLTTNHALLLKCRMAPQTSLKARK